MTEAERDMHIMSNEMSAECEDMGNKGRYVMRDGSDRAEAEVIFTHIGDSRASLSTISRPAYQISSVGRVLALGC